MANRKDVLVARVLVVHDGKVLAAHHRHADGNDVARGILTRDHPGDGGGEQPALRGARTDRPRVDGRDEVGGRQGPAAGGGQYGQGLLAAGRLDGPADHRLWRQRPVGRRRARGHAAV